VGALASIFALILANQALRKIKDNPDLYGGKSMAQAARIISIIELILSLLLLLLVIFILLFVFAGPA
jgi:hypothetical protein